MPEIVFIILGTLAFVTVFCLERRKERDINESHQHHEDALHDYQDELRRNIYEKGSND